MSSRSEQLSNGRQTGGKNDRKQGFKRSHLFLSAVAALAFAAYRVGSHSQAYAEEAAQSEKLQAEAGGAEES